MLPTRAAPTLQVSPVIAPSRHSRLQPPLLRINSQTHAQPKSAPGHRRRHDVAWVPDSLAEKCYSCQASFSLVLRRHHCRRCGNVFCDACSSARMPLVNSGFVAPVRVCAKCSVAAKKAHAKMVQERQEARTAQPARRHSDIADREGSLKGGVYATLLHETGSWHLNEKTRRGSDGPFGYRASHNCSSHDMMKGGIITSNGRRERALPIASQSLERRESEEIEETNGQHDGNYLQTLPGEAVLVKNDNVRVRFIERIEHVGRLYVTNYRLIFSPVGKYPFKPTRRNDCRKVREDRVPYASDLVTESLIAYQAIPLLTIERVKRKEMVETDSGLLEVIGKDFRRLQFVFYGLVSKQTFRKFDRTFALVRMHALGEPEGKVDEFAKFSLERFDEGNDATAGWWIYDAVEEFQRMGLSSSTCRWRLSYVNNQYNICPTYPSILAVPTSVSDSVLAVASKFRSKGRIPVLSWRDRETGAVICRSSQPLVGLGQKQCDMDVFLIQAIAASNPSSSKLVIIDARPWKNAVAQKTVGRAGYELTEHYETRHATSLLKYADMVASEHSAASSLFASVSINGDFEPLNSGYQQLLETKESALVLTECKLIFMGIENIHTMRRSYQKLMELCTTKQNNDKWLDHLASTHWLNHISRILDSAVETVRIVKEQKSSVLIHCSDGWDRTAQLTALTELLLDPFYRTITGFERLIEKEWCSFGHKFRDRTSHGASNNTNETSPIFLQWIDCVWQVMIQFPSSFEFNERFLILILDHLYSCRFGTFLYNSQQERMEQESMHPTQPLWSYLSTVDRATVVNPFYKPRKSSCGKRKTNVTATRECFERPAASPFREPLSTSPSYSSHNDQLLPDDFLVRERKAFDASDWSSGVSAVFGSTRTAATSASYSRNHAIDGDIHANKQSTREQLDLQAQRSRTHPVNVMSNGDELNTHDSEANAMAFEPLSLHQIVRDLDTGLSFPKPLKSPNFSTCSSSPIIVPQEQTSFFARGVANSDVIVRTSTPKLSSSLRSHLKSSAEQMALDGLWNLSDADVRSEDNEVGRYGALTSCEDVIIPSCSIKSLGFWAHYYLRWDPSSHFDRDASVEIETSHLDVLMHLKAKTKVMAEADCTKRHKNSVLPDSHLQENSSPRQHFSRKEKTKSQGSTSSQGSDFGAEDGISLESQIAFLKVQKLRKLKEVEAKYQIRLARLLGIQPLP
ncbi:hypothetical protein CCR75_006665 [Bremia lactucae]|uniref:phosphatidylinositol-3,5-bisphosphate 3-phosphatase n=1 Tax=Bremia lactucae TaxID=4779 RepID=A0A976FL62_BRELC|nr:hypothetical protein CCR75_006665 [Bremia lactucae]